MLWLPRYSPDKVTTARSKVKSRSYHDVLHLHPLTNVPTTYQLPTPYGFQDIARTRFYRSRSLQQGQKSIQGHTMMLPTYTRNQCPYHVSTSYTSQFPRYSPDKILRVKVTMARSNQGHTMTLYTYTPYQMSLTSINFLHVTISEI